jgi:hypothetical protein
MMPVAYLDDGRTLIVVDVRAAVASGPCAGQTK